MGNRELHVFCCSITFWRCYFVEPVAVVSLQYDIPLLPCAVHREAIDQDFCLILAQDLECPSFKDMVRIPYCML